MSGPDYITGLHLRLACEPGKLKTRDEQTRPDLSNSGSVQTYEKVRDSVAEPPDIRQVRVREGSDICFRSLKMSTLKVLKSAQILGTVFEMQRILPRF